MDAQKTFCPPRKTTAFALAALAAGGAYALSPRDASAQFLQRFTLRADVAGGLASADFVGPAARENVPSVVARGSLAISVTSFFAFQVAGGYWHQFSHPDVPSQSGGIVTGGVRLEPMIRRFMRPFLEVSFGAGFPRTGAQFLGEAGVGIEFALAPSFWLGPTFRYDHYTQNATGFDRAAWGLGITLAIRAPAPPEAAPAPPPPAPAAPVDTDGDGVTDDQDQCASVPAGPTPDPARRGCPRPDTDGDGVFDDEDQCREQAQGPTPDPDRRGCPDGDQDGDGVRDHEDQCRTEPRGANPDPNRPGCPLADRDGDTVLDNVDHCPDQPGAPSPNPEQNGCPGLVTITQGQIRISQQIFFATNSDRILPRSFPVLQAVADALRGAPQIRRVSVNGHTDDVGPDERNMQLSQRRSDSVVRWLTEHQIEAGRLEAHGFGETRPMTPVTPALRGAALNAARAQNRRVEFVILDPAQPAAAPAAP